MLGKFMIPMGDILIPVEVYWTLEGSLSLEYSIKLRLPIPTTDWRGMQMSEWCRKPEKTYVGGQAGRNAWSTVSYLWKFLVFLALINQTESRGILTLPFDLQAFRS